MTASRSTSSSTIAADFPPSSSVHRLICSPQIPPTIPPVRAEPVKLTLSMSRWRTRYSLPTRSAETTLTTPAGRPASFAHSPMRRPCSGVSGAVLRIIVEPVAITGPSFIAAMNSGTFHGTMPAQTPTGWRLMSTR